jgi:steroid 5-alpha reductase family enzyme
MHTLPELIGAIFVGMLAIMILAWAWQAVARDTGWVDVFWTFGTGAAGAAAALWPLDPGAEPDTRQILVAVMVLLWSLRLGGYIALRLIGSHAEDARYAGLREKWGKRYNANLFGFLLVQAPVSAVLAMSIALAARAPSPPTGADLGPRDFIGVAIWLVALIGETMADGQMQRFKADPKNRGKICDRGLWAWSRHPNYFFEWTVWLAWPVMALQPADPISWLSLGAPVVMFLILRFATGVPPLERSMLASRGDAFRAYQARTSAFFPLPPRAAPQR